METLLYQAVALAAITIGACGCVSGGTAASIAPFSAAAGPPSEQDIKTEASKAEQRMTHDAAVGTAQATSLRTNVFVGNFVTKVGQYVGGAGAVIFGLDDKGRNAAYSGVVAAAFTLVQQLWDIDGKTRRRTECLGLAKLRLDVEQIAVHWRLNAPDPTYRAEWYEKHYSPVQNRVNEAVKSCLFQ